MTDLINCPHGILHYIITYTLSLGHCPQKLLSTIFWIRILTFTRIHSLTSLWPSLPSYLSAIASTTSSVQLSKNESANSHRLIVPSSHRRTSKNKNLCPPRKQSVQLGRTARSISFCWDREAETRNICHRRIDGCYTRRDINRDNKPDTNGTLKRDNSLSRQRKGTDHFRDSARQMLLPKRETEQSQQASTLWHQE